MEDWYDMDNMDEDVLMKMEHEDGTRVTFLTAPASAFGQSEELEPLVYGLGEKEIYVAFNSELLERLMEDSIEKNSETYGRGASAFLPMTLLINKGLKAVDEYMKNNQ
jgi:hypothetical protein